MDSSIPRVNFNDKILNLSSLFLRVKKKRTNFISFQRKFSISSTIFDTKNRNFIYNYREYDGGDCTFITTTHFLYVNYDIRARFNLYKNLFIRFDKRCFKTSSKANILEKEKICEYKGLNTGRDSLQEEISFANGDGTTRIPLHIYIHCWETGSAVKLPQPFHLSPLYKIIIEAWEIQEIGERQIEREQRSWNKSKRRPRRATYPEAKSFVKIFARNRKWDEQDSSSVLQIRIDTSRSWLELI